MRISEFTEGTYFNDAEFVKHDSHGRDIDFDLVEDLEFFLRNNDSAYRKYVYPVITAVHVKMRAKGSPSWKMFKPAVEECYVEYSNKYPIRELPVTLPDEVCATICKRLFKNAINKSDTK